MSYAEVSATTGGGWEDYEDGAWNDLPVTLQMENPGIVALCPIPLTAPVIGMTSCTSVTVSSYSRIELTAEAEFPHDCDNCPDGQHADPPFTVGVTRSTAKSTKKGAAVHALPDLPKSFERMNTPKSSFGVLAFRGGLPMCRHSTYHECWILPFEDCEPPDGLGEPKHLGGSLTHPRLPKKWGVMGEAVHDIESPLSYPSLAPYTWFAEYNEVADVATRVTSPGVCVDGDGDGTYDKCGCLDDLRWRKYRYMSASFPNVDTRSLYVGNPDMLPALYHSDPTVRYLNYWAAVHFNFFSWWPPDADPSYWKVRGVKENSNEYWLKIGEQHFDLGTLPVSERDRRRNHVVSEPLLEGGWKRWIKNNVLGVESNWLGNNAFIVQTEVPAASKQLDSSMTAPWSFASCTSNFVAGGIELTSTSGANFSATLDIARFLDSLYMYPAIAKEITIDWDSANVVGVDVFLVNPWGQSTLLASTAGKKARPQIIDDNYASTYGQDFGVGVVTDTGSDLESQGRSALSMIVEELVFDLELLAGYGAASIRFEIEVSNPAVKMTLKYPTFHRSEDGVSVVQECRQAATLIWPNGPSIRFGQWDFWDNPALGMHIPPEVLPIGSASSVLDWLAYKRLVLQAKAADDGLNTEIISLYDGVEGQTRSDVASDTLSFIVPGGIAGRGILVNSWAELPPMPTWAHKQRDGNLAKTGPYVQESHVLAIGKRYYVSTKDPIHLDDPGPPRVQWTVDSPDFVVPGYKVTEHQRPVTNNEDVNFIVEALFGDAGEVTPWHGYSFEGGLGLAGSGGIHLTKARKLGIIFAVIATDAAVVLRRFNFAGLNEVRTVLAEVVDSAQVAWHPRGDLKVVYDQSGATKLIESESLGDDWSSPVSVASLTNPAIAIDEKTAIEYVAGHDGSEWRLYRKDYYGQAWTNRSAISVAPTGRAGIEVSSDVLGHLVFMVDDSGVIRRYISTDFGESWVESS